MHEDESIVPAREVALCVLRASRDVGVKRAMQTLSFAEIGYGQKPGERRSTRRIGRAHDGDGVTDCVKSRALAKIRGGMTCGFYGRQ